MKSQSAEIKQEEEVLLETKLCHYFGLNYVGENMQLFNKFEIAKYTTKHLLEARKNDLYI